MNNKRYKFILLFLCIIFTFISCANKTGNEENQNNQDNNVSLQEDTSGTDKKDDKSDISTSSGSQTLNVATLSQPGIYGGINVGMQEKIENAMREIYPDFELNIKAFTDKDAYNKDIQTLLMSGKPYDLIYIDSDLQIDKFIENEYFKDIYEMIENDKSVHIDDYYVNALKAYESNGKLYKMPMNFYYHSLIGINTNISKESIDQYKKLDCISVTSMLDIFKKNKENNNLFMINSMGHRNLIQLSIGSYIDFENKTCDFNNDRFMNLLTDIKDSMYSVTGYEAFRENFKVTSTNFIPKDYDIIFNTSMFTQRLKIHLVQSLLDFVDPYLDHFKPMTNENDELVITSDIVYGIGNTANAEMAWDFLNFYIDIYNEDITLYENILYGNANIPIKKEYFVDKFTYYMYQFIAESNGTSIQVGETTYGGGDVINYCGELIYDIDTTINRAMEKLEKYNSMPMKNVQDIDIDGSLYSNTITDFMKGLITVDQAAQQIQNNVTIYLSE